MPIINFYTTNTNTCGCNNQNRTIILQRQNNNIKTQNERVAQFVSLNSVLIESAEVIPLVNTQFNNISASVRLSDVGTILLLEQGVYEIQFNVVVSNPNATPVDIIISLIRDGTPQTTLTRAVSTVEPSGTTTISNSFIDSVVSGTTQEIQLVNSSLDEVLIISANVIVKKIT